MNCIMRDYLKNKKLIFGTVIIVSIGGTVALYFYIKWILHYIGYVSVSVSSNWLYMCLWILLLLVVCLAESLIVREIYMGRIERGRREREFGGRLDREEISKEIARQVREAKVLWTVYVGLPVVFNLLLLNYLSGGFVLSGQGGFSRYATIATLLRSRDEGQRREGIEEAVGSENRALGRYLAQIIRRKGGLSAMAAWAAGLRKDRVAAPALRELFKGGNEKQRAAAAIALSRIGDDTGMHYALNALKEGKEPKIDIIVALGNSQFVDAEDEIIRIASDETQPEPVRATAFWAISRFEQERFKRAFERDSKKFGFSPSRWVAPERKGWEPMLEAIKGRSQLLKCAGVQALRYTGPVKISRELIKLFESSGRREKCQRFAVKHFKYVEFEIVRFGLIRSEILRALAGIGDRGILKWLELVAEDRKNPDEVILIARGVARQIRKLKH